SLAVPMTASALAADSATCHLDRVVGGKTVETQAGTPALDQTLSLKAGGYDALVILRSGEQFGIIRRQVSQGGIYPLAQSNTRFEGGLAANLDLVAFLEGEILRLTCNTP